MVVIKSEMRVNIMVMVGFLVLIMVPKTFQLSIDTQRVEPVVDRMNNKAEGPFLGIVLSSDNDEKRLSTSGYFQYDRARLPIIHAGRKFNIGKFNGVPAVYVVAKSPLAYVSETVQMMLDKFNIFGVLDYGSAATVTDDLDVGDVAVLKASAFTGFWTWRNSENSGDLLRFGDYNIPKAGDNKLASAESSNVVQYTPSNSDQMTYWINAHHAWYQVASQLTDVALDNCIGDRCFLKRPKLVPGVKGSSADVLLSNEAYGQLLNQKLGIFTVDRKSAATASTAIANGVPHIVLRAATNRPGEEYDKNKASLGVQNTLKLAATFAHRIFHQPRAHKLINYYSHFV